MNTKDCIDQLKSLIDNSKSLIDPKDHKDIKLLNGKSENLVELMTLIQENPTLPVILPMVDGEIVCDDSYQRWIGERGHSKLDSYWVGEEHIHFRSECDEGDFDEMKRVLYDCKDVGFDDIKDLTDDECIEMYNSLPWTKAIIVYIDEPN